MTQSDTAVHFRNAVLAVVAADKTLLGHLRKIGWQSPPRPSGRIAIWRASRDAGNVERHKRDADVQKWGRCNCTYRKQTGVRSDAR